MKITKHNAIYLILILFLYYCYYDKINKFFHMRDAFEGKIISKEIHFRGSPNVRLANDEKETHNLVNWKIFDSVDTGDYVIKKSGSMSYMLIKKNKDTIIY